MKSVAQARSNATEQSSNLFAGISGTELSAEQADAHIGEYDKAHQDIATLRALQRTDLADTLENILAELLNSKHNEN